MDTVDAAKRSEIMRSVRGRDTGPEMVVRRLTHSLGFRYRLHDRELPGCPDLVFRSRKKVIFVHGCFWHQHKGCQRAQLPTSRTEYWAAKLGANKKRDVRNCRKLARLGWEVLTLWECRLGDLDRLARRIGSFLHAESEQKY
jgi:DNA mismatch endonuclease (patch repair protein)